MTRKREYDREVVLEKAMKVFWEKGFEGGSMQALVDATGLNRFSLYDAFGSKDGLFLEALDKYHNDVMAQAVAVLKLEPKGLQSIRDFFAQLVRIFSKADGMKGCFMTNTAVDLPQRNMESASRVGKHLKRMENDFHECLFQAAERGEIGAKSDLAALARYLVMTVSGFGVLARADSNRKHFESVVEVALGVLMITDVKENAKTA